MTDPVLIDRLRAAKEVRILTETARGERHSAIIWVVIDGADRILARSYHGATARWYREAMSGRPVALEVGGAQVAMRIERATDPGRVAACSAGFEDKYAGDPSTPAMVRDEVLDTTVELAPL